MPIRCLLGLLISIYLFVFPARYCLAENLHRSRKISIQTDKMLARLSQLKPKFPKQCRALSLAENQSSSPIPIGDLICSGIKEIESHPETRLAMLGGPEFPLCKILWDSNYSPGTKRQNFNSCGKQNDRYSSTYVTPKKRQANEKGLVNILEPKNKKIKREVQDLFATDRESQIEKCCPPGSPSDCERILSQVKMDICVPPENPEAEDNCQDLGTQFFYFESDPIKFSKNKKEFLKSPSSGVVSLSPYMSLDEAGNISWQSIQESIHHELAHACVFIQSQLMAQSEDKKIAEDSSQFLTGFFDLKKRCEDDPKIRNHFLRLFKNLTGNNELAKCLMEISPAQTADNGFSKCENYCVAISYNETYAMADTLVNLTYPKYPDYLSGCDGFRDRQHPASIDVLECFTRYSDNFRGQLKKNISCDVSKSI